MNDYDQFNTGGAATRAQDSAPEAIAGRTEDSSVRAFAGSTPPPPAV